MGTDDLPAPDIPSSPRPDPAPNAEASEETVGEERAPHTCPVVGLGGSAGGLEAFQKFFSHMPPDSGMAFVLVQHLDPNRESLMSELLAKATAMPVRQVEDETPIEPNHVYVIPPNTTLTLDGGLLRTQSPLLPRGHRMPIDHFLYSLAEDQADNAIGIVLSGTGSDGTLGLKAVKGAGGMTVAQTPETAKYDSMPRSAIETGLVDYVLPVEEMPAKLVEFSRHLLGRQQCGPDRIRGETHDRLADICSVLRRKTGHDFRRYKHSTLARRIERRMQIRSVESVEAYVELLRNDAKEPRELFKELLVGVTHFFRDPETFEVLSREIIAKIISQKAAGDQLRIWVPGCATGEEAYSIAILVDEQLAGSRKRLGVQLFATDIDTDALEIGRRAMYPEGIVEQVSPPRLERYFARQGAGYQVAKEIREMCIFSPQNLIKDPPFSRLDLISCRNVLIYFQPDLQKKLMPVFRYALNPEGYLLLGPSEGIASNAELFRIVSRDHKIFQARETLAPLPVQFPLMDRGDLAREERPLPVRSQAEHERNVAETFERLLLANYVPASAIINERGDVVYASGRTSRYLELPPGKVNVNIVNMARAALRLNVRTAIHKATTTLQEVVQENLSIEIEGKVQKLNLIVRPLDDARYPGLFIVVFQELGAPTAAGGTEIADAAAGMSESMVEGLEVELQSTREYLHSTIEELETANEELKSSNEELLSLNEELQSSNEELQTSKQELQSMNEELQTVNAELSTKVDELDDANSDLQNLLESTQIPTIFLGEDLVVRKFTPVTKQMFRLIDGDVGRPITDVVARFSDGQVVDAVRRVLGTLERRELQVRTPDDDRWWIVRVLPYRTVKNVIDGVVITFTDVTDFQREHMKAARLAAIVQSSQDAIIGETFDGTITSCNSAAERMFGYTAEEAVGQSAAMLFHEDRVGELYANLERVKRGETVAPQESVRRRKDGTLVDVSVRFSAVRDAAGTPVGVSAIVRDITDRKRAEEALRKSEALLRAVTDNSEEAIYLKDRDSRLVFVNPAVLRVVGKPAEQIVGHTDSEFYDDPVVGAAILEHDRQVMTGGRPLVLEETIDTPKGRRTMLSSKVPWRDGDGQVIGIIGISRDITERKLMETELADAKEAAESASRAKDHFLAALSHELRTPLTPVVMAVSMLQRRPGLDQDLSDQLKTIRSNVEMEARLIDDLLDVTRIASGKIQLRKRRIDLCQVVEHAVDVCRPDIEARGLEFGVDTGPAAPYWLDADPARIQQVCWNLLKNAIKFTPHGGCVGLRCWPEDGQVVLEVADSGIGIEPESLSRLFVAFEQVDRSITRQFGGLGLGLAISKSLVEQHGGTISVHSDGKDKGAIFRVRLPLCAPAGQADPPSPKVPAQRSVRPLRILLVEDHGVTAQMMQRLLEAEGHTAEMAGAVARALELARRDNFDLLLSDLGLPDGSGHDLMRRLRERGHQFPGIALSGYGQGDDIRRSRDAGFAAHLIKPASREALLETIASVIHGQEVTPTDDAASVPESDAPVFDRSAAMGRCFGDEDFLLKMIRALFDDVDTFLPQIHSALEEGNLHEVRRIAHRLRGTIARLAAQPAAEAALRVERVESDGGGPDEAAEAVKALDRQCQALVAALAEYRDGPAPPDRPNEY